MPTSRILRNLAFVVTMGATVVAMQSHVLAMGSSIGEFCYAYYNGYGCPPCSYGGIPPLWNASGTCDFSGQEDPEEVAGWYCYNEGYACASDCEGQYPYFLADYFSWATSESDPCYDVATDPYCWFTWAGGSCTAGSNSSWTCGCSGWNWCECGR